MTVTTASTLRPVTSSGPLPASLRIVIPGGRGHLGRILARHFSSNGHQVTTLTRKPHCAFSVPSTPGQRAILWDGRTLGDWVRELDGSDVVINLAGRSVDCRYTPPNKEEILESRVASTTVLGSAICAVRQPPRIWLNASTATIYRDSYDQEMDEMGELGGLEPGVPTSWRFSIEVAKSWERALFGADTPRTRKVAMRAAMVMSLEPGGIFSPLLHLTRMGLGGRWGTGRQWISWIHDQDLCRIEFLIQQESFSGVVNISAPAPLPNYEFLAALREACGVGFGLPITRWMLAAGAFVVRTETELLLKSRRVTPRRLAQNGFRFLFPEWHAAARDLVQTWRCRRQSQERRVA
jgi:uncharacterized protein (TIGR01777 family)